jgi:hypothetical protein
MNLDSIEFEACQRRTKTRVALVKLQFNQPQNQIQSIVSPHSKLSPLFFRSEPETFNEFLHRIVAQ